MGDPSPAADTVDVDCDFLIVGAGSSGCVLASRLVRAGLKVLLIEKGPADAATLSKLVTRPADWLRSAFTGRGLSEAFLTVPQAGLDNRRIPAPRGRGGGGTSNVNAGLYQRGREKDYEEHWPWELKDIEASFKSIEAELTLEEQRTTGTIMPSCDHMFEEIGLKRSSPSSCLAESITTNTTTTTNLAEYSEPTWTKEGLGGCPMKRTTTRGGERQSAWAAFVGPVTTMPNLRVKDSAVVSRVIVEGGRAVGVEVVESLPRLWWGGGRTQVRQLRLAKEKAEIFICCGAFRSPKLLMLSGVGPREHLEEKGVGVVVDIPHVGKNLQDHLTLASVSISKRQMVEADYTEGSYHGVTYFSCALPPPPLPPRPPQPLPSQVDPCSTPSSSSTADSDRDVSKTVAATASSAPSAVAGVLCFDGDDLSQNLGPNICMLVARPGFLGAAMRFAVLAVCWVAGWVTPIRRVLRGSRGMLMVLTSIRSKGTVRLASGTDVSAPPLIDPAYFSHPEDRQAACEMWRMVRRAKSETATGQAVFGPEILPGRMYNYGNDDESFLKYARSSFLPFFHPVGTCRMGHGVEDSVVSADDLRVHGISGLRVADASVAPHIPATPTQAMCMMIGDRAAAIVLKDRFAKDQMQARMLETVSTSIN
eukprot:g1874.t1